MKSILALLLSVTWFFTSTGCAAPLERAGDSAVDEYVIIDKDMPAGDNSILLTLTEELTVYTEAATLCVDAATMKVRPVLWREFDVGESVKVWSDTDVQHGRARAYCILENHDEVDFESALLRVSEVEFDGDSVAVVDANGNLIRAAAKDVVSPDALIPDAMFLLLYTAGEDGKVTALKLFAIG